MGLDGQWVDEFHHALHSVVTGEVNGYYEDFGEMSHLAKSYKDSYVYTGQYSKHRKKKFGVLPKELSFDRFVTFAQNHDQIGNRMLGDRLTTQLSFAGLKVVAASYLLSPHVPMLFMGEEYGERNPFQYFVSHSDKELIEAIRKGRKQEFSYFNWDGDVPDPQSIKTFNVCKLSWDHSGDAKTLITFYKTIIELRKNRPAMRGVERDSINVFPVNGRKIIAFKRFFEGDFVLVVLNFEKKVESFDLINHHSWSKIFDSSSEKWGGPGEITAMEISPGEPFRLNPESVVVFELKR
jgi:maltooligosyltrehalose trehalohydrolase